MADTKQQQIAQAIDRHMTVMANAGSGKTRVLIKRYINILKSGEADISPAKIVAITFTRKAAAEMKKKIADELDKEYNEATLWTDKKALLKARESLDAGAISTIHSFCVSLLREFPVEAGINPNFRDISEVEKLRLRAQAYDFVLDDWLNGDDFGRKTKLTSLIHRYGNKSVRDIAGLFNSNIDNKAYFDELYSTDNPADRQDEYIKILLDYSWKFWGPYIEKMYRAAQKYAELDRAPDDMEKLELAGHWIKDKKVHSINPLREFLVQYVTKDYTHRKSGKCKKIENVADHYHLASLHTEHLKPLAPSISDDPDNPELYDRLLYEDAVFLYYFASEVNSEYRDLKHEMGAIEFDDMLTMARDLLGNEEVVRQVRSRYSYVMIDEFQDTSQIQYDIILRLFPELSGKPLDDKGPNLFIVGDDKQSIYGFRNADVRVFRQAREHIGKYNSELVIGGKLDKRIMGPDGYPIKVKMQEAAGNVGLNATFRLLPQNAAFVNAICSQIMTANAGYEVGYSELVFGDPDEDGTDKYNQGRVTLLNSVVATLDKEADDIEANKLVNTLVKLINDSNGRYKFSDICILARKKKNFPKLATALANKSIPYIIHSGRGFYQSQEVTDLLNCLIFLYDRGDDLALAASLRSPLFGFSDNDLLRISASTAEKLSLWEKLTGQADSQIDGTYGMLVGRAFNIWSSLIDICDRLPISTLLQMILRRTDWYASISQSQFAPQSRSNVSKLISNARSFEQMGFHDLYDFIEELKILNKSVTGEAEPAILTSDNAVNIMTIHASKGLEFPVVALFNSGKAMRPQVGKYLTQETGLGMNLQIKGSGDNLRLLKRNTLASVVGRTINNAKDEAEEKRLFYVAITRAREQLIISGQIYENAAGTLNAKGYMQMLTNAPEFSYYYNDRTNRKVVFTDSLAELKSGMPVKRDIELGVDIVFDIDDCVLEAKQSKTESDRMATDLSAIIESSFSGEYLSATKLALLSNDQDKYINQYILGLGEMEQDREEAKANQSAPESDAAKAGSLFHSVMESVNVWYQNAETDDEELKRIVEIKANGLELHQKEYYDKAYKLCQNTCATGFIKDNHILLQNAEFELELEMPIEEDFIRIIIDLLVKRGNGEYEIWDWKTNHIPHTERYVELCLKYKPQMLLYCYVISFMFPDQQEFTARLLFVDKAGPGAQDESWIKSYTWARAQLAEYRQELLNGIEKVKGFML